MSHVVRYRVHEGHKTETKKGEETLQGSLHHPELDEFTGLVTRSRPDGTHDIVIFPPNRAPVHVDNVTEGEGAHQIRFAGELPKPEHPHKKH